MHRTLSSSSSSQYPRSRQALHKSKLKVSISSFRATSTYNHRLKVETAVMERSCTVCFKDLRMVSETRPINFINSYLLAILHDLLLKFAIEIQSK